MTRPLTTFTKVVDKKELSVFTSGGARAWWWALGAALPLVQTWYLAVGWLRTFVPLLGRAGTRAPPDLAAALVVAALVLAATSWLLPLVAAAASLRRTVTSLSSSCPSRRPRPLHPLTRSRFTLSHIWTAVV